jgi:thioredoxin 1
MSKEEIKNFTDDSFHNGIQHGVVLVDFYADWCGPCRMMKPILEKIAGESQPAIIAKVDIEEAQKIAANFRITSVPTLILFKDGAEVDRLVGLQDANAIKEFIKSAP